MVPVYAWLQFRLIAFCLLMARLLLHCTPFTALCLHCHMDASRLQAVFANSTLFLLSAIVRTGDSCRRPFGITRNHLLVISPFTTLLSGRTTAGLELASACALEFSDTLVCQGHVCSCAEQHPAWCVSPADHHVSTQLTKQQSEAVCHHQSQLQPLALLLEEGSCCLLGAVRWEC